MKKLTGLVICGGMIWCSCVMAAELASVEKGKQLFGAIFQASTLQVAVSARGIRELVGDAQYGVEGIEGGLEDPRRPSTHAFGLLAVGDMLVVDGRAAG